MCKFICIFAVMKTTTKAILLHVSKYSDRASVLHAYTLLNGRLSFMLYGARSRTKGGQLAAFEPLSLVEIEYSSAVGRDMPVIGRLSLDYIPSNTVSDIRRRTVAVFIAEVLMRTLRHPEPDEVLFGFLSSTVQQLDTTPCPENFHLSFLLQFTRFLGIMPSLSEFGGMLDIPTGIIHSFPTDICFTADETAALVEIMQDINLVLTRQQRQFLLTKLCLYYQYHLTDFSDPKSLDVLKEIFD